MIIVIIVLWNWCEPSMQWLQLIRVFNVTKQREKIRPKTRSNDWPKLNWFSFTRRSQRIIGHKGATTTPGQPQKRAGGGVFLRPHLTRLHDNNGRLVFLAILQLTMHLTPGAPLAETGCGDVVAERTLRRKNSPDYAHFTAPQLLTLSQYPVCSSTTEMLHHYSISILSLTLFYCLTFCRYTRGFHCKE